MMLNLVCVLRQFRDEGNNILRLMFKSILRIVAKWKIVWNESPKFSSGQSGQVGSLYDEL